MITKLISKRSSHNGVTLQVIVPETIAAGRSVELLILLRNHSAKEVLWTSINGYRDCDIRILDAKMQPCPYTEFGRSVMPRLGDVQQGRIAELTELRPADSHVWAIDLNRIFVFKPGKYKLSVSIGLRLRSNPSDGFAVTVEEFEITVAA